MKQNNHPRLRFTTRSGIAAICLAVFAALALSVGAGAQTRDRGQPAQRRGPEPSQRRDSVPQRREVHAQRETVRTNPAPVRTPPRVPSPPVRDATPRREPVRPDAGQRPDNRTPATRPDRTPQNAGQRIDRTNPAIRPDRTPGRPNDRVPPGVLAHRLFTRTQEGRRYDNGMLLRKGHPVDQAWQRPWFPRGRFHYPYYSPSYISGSVVISPFGFYFGVCAPFITRAHCYRFPPVVVYVDIPLYIGDSCRGYAPIRREDNYLNRDDLLEREPGLANAIDDLRETFRGGNIDALVTLTDPKIRIAVFLRGRYEYSLDANDYVDLTRDALQSTETIAFDLTRIHERAAGVYVVSGEHVYRDHDGRSRKVYVSYVLEDIGGVWTLTQVGTAPDRIQEWR